MRESVRLLSLARLLRTGRAGTPAGSVRSPHRWKVKRLRRSMTPHTDLLLSREPARAISFRARRPCSSRVFGGHTSMLSSLGVRRALPRSRRRSDGPLTLPQTNVDRRLDERRRPILDRPAPRLHDRHAPRVGQAQAAREGEGHEPLLPLDRDPRGDGQGEGRPVHELLDEGHVPVPGLARCVDLSRG